MLARGVRILLYEAPHAYAPPPWRLLPSNLHSVCRLALREGVRHVVHLPHHSELLGLLGLAIGDVRADARGGRAAERDACDHRHEPCVRAHRHFRAELVVESTGTHRDSR